MFSAPGFPACSSICAGGSGTLARLRAFKNDSSAFNGPKPSKFGAEGTAPLAASCWSTLVQQLLSNPMRPLLSPSVNIIGRLVRTKMLSNGAITAKPELTNPAASIEFTRLSGSGYPGGDTRRETLVRISLSTPVGLCRNSRPRVRPSRDAVPHRIERDREPSGATDLQCLCSHRWPAMAYTLVPLSETQSHFNTERRPAGRFIFS